MMKTLSAVFAVLLLTTWAAATAGITTFDCSAMAGGGPRTLVMGINNAGAIVGQCRFQGFLFANGVYTMLRGMSIANGINNLGQIVGQNGAAGVLYSNGTYTAINFPGAETTAAFGINDHGTIVGIYQVSDGHGGFSQHGFVYSNGTYTTFDYPGSPSTYLGGINNSGQIVGLFCDAGCQVGHGFLVTGSTYTQIDYPGALGSGAYGINNNGIVVGGYNNQIAFIYDHGRYQSIDFNSSPDTAFNSINDLGQFVGYWVEPPVSFRGLRGYVPHP
jgi:probable HAF family extracellular repeat protein